ncbi:hypothetical protein SLH49_05275 [Cognatiyoonia sp. IB215446]|uniref:hypothetical protein n=1 Tax=Cognatiyoonia sp. IB215446 TaxID=3097355 RepID=UPI002A0DC847|nr:hypothetical protein [Cognatiyoonia sp. IB215446]MDX8347393.1 hypothetical protein [Cognatiyoonia sp. IB215446]
MKKAKGALKWIYEALLADIKSSSKLHMDETHLGQMFPAVCERTLAGGDLHRLLPVLLGQFCNAAGTDSEPLTTPLNARTCFLL